MPAEYYRALFEWHLLESTFQCEKNVFMTYHTIGASGRILIDFKQGLMLSMLHVESCLDTVSFWVAHPQALVIDRIFFFFFFFTDRLVFLFLFTR